MFKTVLLLHKYAVRAKNRYKNKNINIKHLLISYLYVDNIPITTELFIV